MKQTQIIQKRNIFYVIALAVILFCISAIIFIGLPLDISFASGSELYFDLHNKVSTEDIEKIKEILSESEIKDKILEVNISENNHNQITVKTSIPENSSEALQIKQTLTKSLSDEYSDMIISGSEFFSPKSAKVSINAFITSIVVIYLLIVLYVLIRFKLNSALTTLICLIFNGLVVFASYSFLKIPVNEKTLLSIFVIAVYTAITSVIFFGRISQSIKQNKKSALIIDQLNNVSEQTSSLLYSFTVIFLIPLIILCFSFENLRALALPMTIGIIASGFSALFLYGSLFYSFRKK